LDEGDLLPSVEGHGSDRVPGLQVGLGLEEQESGGWSRYNVTVE